MNVVQAYLQYDFAVFKIKAGGTREMQQKRLLSDTLYLQLSGSDELASFPLKQVRSIELLPDSAVGHGSKGIVVVVLNNGQLIDCRLGYWPVDLLFRALLDDSQFEMIGDCNRSLRGELTGTGDGKRFNAKFESLKTVKFGCAQGPDPLAESRAVIARLKHECDSLRLKIEELRTQLRR